MNDNPKGPVADETEDGDVYELEDTGDDLDEVLAAAVAAEGGEGSTGISAVDSAEMSRLQDENASLRDQVLRSRADFDNFRKRIEREKTDYFRYALSGLLQELLAVVDNFERALAAAPSPEDDFHRGIEMIHKQLTEVLQKAGLREVEESERFDPTVHEAVMREERSDVPSNTILQTFQKGYFLHDRLLRPAMVKVAVGGREATPESEG